MTGFHSRLETPNTALTVGTRSFPHEVSGERKGNKPLEIMGKFQARIFGRITDEGEELTSQQGGEIAPRFDISEGRSGVRKEKGGEELETWLKRGS